MSSKCLFIFWQFLLFSFLVVNAGLESKTQNDNSFQLNLVVGASIDNYLECSKLVTTISSFLATIGNEDESRGRNVAVVAVLFSRHTNIELVNETCRQEINKLIEFESISVISNFNYESLNWDFRDVIRSAPERLLGEEAGVTVIVTHNVVFFSRFEFPSFQSISLEPSITWNLSHFGCNFNFIILSSKAFRILRNLFEIDERKQTNNLVDVDILIDSNSSNLQNLTLNPNIILALPTEVMSSISISTLNLSICVSGDTTYTELTNRNHVALSNTSLVASASFHGTSEASVVDTDEKCSFAMVPERGRGWEEYPSFSSLVAAFSRDRSYCNWVADTQFLRLRLHSSRVTLLPLKLESDSGTNQHRIHQIKDARSLPLDPDQRKRSIYVYDWDRKFAYPFPVTHGGYTSDETGVINIPEHRYRVLEAEHQQKSVNFGAGSKLSESEPLFDTAMHSLFTNIYERLLLSSARTTELMSARAYFIPYDITADTPFGSEARAQPGCPLAREVASLLAQSAAWRRSEGKDHFLVISSLPTNQITHKRCADFLLNFCRNCVKITIENNFNPRVSLEDTSLRSLLHGSSSHYGVRERWWSVPYVSSYHLPPDWEATWVSGSAASRERPVTVTFIGSAWVGGKVRYRPLLRKLCLAAAPACAWIEVEAVSHTNQSFSTGLVHHYRDSVFCLMPGGPTWSRKATVDAIVSGCVPVVFHLETLHLLWPFHLDPITASAISVFFPSTELDKHIATNESELSFLDIPLMSWLIATRDSPETSLKRHIIAETAYRLQYSLPFNDRNNATNLNRHREDAFEVILNNMLNS